ncbi:uncharacterized protein [Amphiura filiformis]|uniref:uncharacterized protein n=1 Tax=Amphiura filiformis TaxID=82378 RepID=UPI003B222A95
MAETSTLASTIDRHFLECVICSEPFNDPRALPCLHPFCCECLENWAKSCSNDNSIVSCPLCKKIYQIPEEEGIKGFPVHFLVTNLQDTVDKAKQKNSTTELCDNHGQEKKYFCENCGCAACSDCGILDPTHRGHSLIRLKEASQRQSSSLESLTRRVKIVEEKYTTAVHQIQQVKQNLDRDTDVKVQAIDEARNEFVQQVDNLVRAYKQDACSKKEENLRAIEQIEEKLQVDLASLRSSNALASNVIESGSDSDIISLYPSLSSSLQQSAESQPTLVDSKLGRIKLERPQPTSTDLPSLEQLLCDKLHITTSLTQHPQVSHQTSNLSAKAATAELLPSATAKYLPSSSAAAATIKPLAAFTAKAQVNTVTASGQDHQQSTSKHEASQDQSFSLFSKSQSVPNTQPSIQPIFGKKWKYCGQIKTTPQVRYPMGIAIHRNRDIILTSISTPVTVFSRNGDFKHVIKGSPSEIFDIAITPSNQYIIPGKCDKTGFYICDSRGVLVSTIPTYDMNNKPSSPTSVAVDSTGRIIAGLGSYGDKKTVSIHQPNGTLVSKFETTSSPSRLTCTPDDKLIISFEDNTLQVMDQSGHNASLIQPPPSIQSWKPYHVCCSKQGELFVGNQGYPDTVVSRYVCTGGEYKYLNCITTMESYPWGIALSADEHELFVVDWGSNCVKIFR